MRTRLPKAVHYAAMSLVALIVMVIFLLALMRAEAPVVASEMPEITLFLTKEFNHPVQIQSARLHWHHFMPLLQLRHIKILGDTLCNIDELKLGYRFILVRGLQVDFSPSKQVSPAPSFSSKSFGYFKHIVIENSVIQYKDKIFTISDLNLRKTLTGEWTWQGQHIVLGLGKLFLAPIQLDNTTGEFWIKTESGRWNIVAHDISADNPAISLAGNLSLQGAPDESPVIDLQVYYTLTDQFTAQVKNYLPQTVLSPPLKQWLVQSIQKIQGGQGKFVLKGKLSDFPYTKHPGEFLVDAELQGVNLHYFKNWPSVSDMNAELIFAGSQMQVHIHSAQTEGIMLQNMDASIPVLGKKSILIINGNINSDASQAIVFVRKSPLEKTLGKKFDGLNWTGPIQTHLQLHIPLSISSGLPVQVKGEINLNNNQLKIPAKNIVLTNLTGNIAFTQKGFTSQQLTGMYLKSPVTIRIGQSGHYQIDYQQWHANVTSIGKDSWRAMLKGPVLQGTIELFPAHLSAVLNYLDIPSKTMENLKQDFVPSRLPAMVITVKQADYKKMKLGSIILKTEPSPQGLLLHYFSVGSHSYHITAQGKWQNNHYSSLEGILKSTDLAKTLTRWGFAPDIQSNDVTASFQLQWPGEIYSPNVKKISGHIILNMGKGQIITSGSQAKMDFGRLITLLSVESLERRLRLDFTDLTQQGLSFDQIVGSMNINDGIVSTEKFKINGPVAKVMISGNINLIDKMYHLHVEVTPHLTSSLPIVATLAGGPVVGAAAWAASKVVNPLLNHVTTNRYSVSGPWSNPVIKGE